MATVGAVQDVPTARGGGRRGLGVWQGSGALSSGVVAFATPFKTVVAALPQIDQTTAPTTSEMTYHASAGTVTVYGWKASAAGTTTLVATTGTENVSCVVVGIL